MTPEATIKNLEKNLSVVRNLSAALHTAATAALKEIDEIKTTHQSPAKPRRKLKDERVEQYAVDVAAGTWSKPKALRKKP